MGLQAAEHSGFAHPADLREQFEHNFTSCRPPFGFWVAEEAGQVLGFQSLLPCTSNPLKRHLLAESSTYVAAGEQDRGVGEPLLRRALAEAQTNGLQFVLGYVLAANERVVNMVERCGFASGTNLLIPQQPPFDTTKRLWVYTVPGNPA